MNLTNYHSHCLYCDGKADMDTFIRFAISSGFTSYGFSSHAPLPFNTPWTMEWDQIDNYFAEFRQVKDKYQGQIECYIGLEIDYLNEKSNPASVIFQSLPLDYRIGSVHLLSNDKNELIDVDVAPAAFIDIVTEHFNGNLVEMIHQYYERQFRMIELGGFDIIGHADKMLYNSLLYRSTLLDEPWCRDLVYDYFSTIAKCGYIVEVNTKSYESNKIFYPNQKYFSLIRDLGVRVMVNSDSHSPEKINSGRLTALELLRSVGFTTVVERYNNEWQDVKISLL